ncbi:MAG TPA: manganese efflux pump [Ktedonobacteraceae bacterium]|nr:manganese efflux pump [Ktedonobacteraceae bacterium]
MPVASLLLFILPLGLDTLGVSISLGIKSHAKGASGQKNQGTNLPDWLRSALFFSLAEMLMPLVGLAIGFAASAFIGQIMHFVGPLLLIGVGAWELVEEGREYIAKRRKSHSKVVQRRPPREDGFRWGAQLLLALSISLDELAIGFSLGAITNSASGGRMIQPVILCIFIGLQGFLMTLIGLALGRTLRSRLKPIQELSELLSAFLLIGLGIWFLVT